MCIRDRTGFGGQFSTIWKKNYTDNVTDESCGLSGVGDLIVTGTSVHSRNWRAGDALGRGEALADIEANMGMVIEGISTTKAAYELAQELGVYMPITQAIYQVIYENVNIKDAVSELMSNEFKAENEWS